MKQKSLVNVNDQSNTEAKQTPPGASSQQTAQQKPLSAQRLKDRKLAETYIQKVVTEQGTLTDVAEAMPERFPHPDSVKNIRSHVYNRIQSESVQSEIQAILPTFDLADLAYRTKKKISRIVDAMEDKPTAPQALLAQTALKLAGELVDKQEVKQSQHIDTSTVNSMSSEERTALLLELIRLESAGVQVTQNTK